MIPPLKPGASLMPVDGPVIETERLILRPWRESDIAPNTAMLSDPDTARFITPDGKPVTTELGGWRNAAVIAGHLGAAWLRHVRGRGEIERPICRAGRAVVAAGLARLRGRLGHCPGISRQGLCGGSGTGVDRLGFRDL